MISISKKNSLQKKTSKETLAHPTRTVAQNKSLQVPKLLLPSFVVPEPRKERNWKAAIWGGGIAICIIGLLAAVYLNNANALPITPTPTPPPTPMPPPAPTPTPKPSPVPTPIPPTPPHTPIPTPSSVPSPIPPPTPSPTPTPPTPIQTPSSVPSPTPTPPTPIPPPSPVPIPAPPSCTLSADFVFSKLKDLIYGLKSYTDPKELCSEDTALSLDIIEFFKRKELFPRFLLPVLEAYGKSAKQQFDISPKELAEFEKIKSRLERLAPELMGTSTSDALEVKIKETELTHLAFSARSSIPFNAQKLFKDWKGSIDAFDLSLRRAAPEIRSPNYLIALKNEPSQQIDDRLFQHILGDYWGGQTGLEGYGSLEMLQYLIRIINLQIRELDANPLCTNKDRSELCQIVTGVKSNDPALYSAVRDLFQGGVKFTSEIDTSKNLAINQNLKNELESMFPGQNRIFMGGWTNRDEGHAIYYEIAKQKDGAFTVRLFNRGAGLDYHATGLIEEQTRSTPFWEISNVALDRLISPIFFLGMQELSHPPIEGNPWKGSDVYEGLISGLQGTVARQSQNYDPKTAMENLKVGHCTFLSLTGLLQRLMGNHFKRYSLDLQFKTLWDYYSEQKGDLATNHFQRKLLKKGSAQLAKNGQRLFVEKYVRAEELNVIKDALKEIDDAIGKAESNPTIPPKSLGIESPQQLQKTAFKEIKPFDFSDSSIGSDFQAIDVIPFDPELQSFDNYCFDFWEKKIAPVMEGKGNYPMVKEAIKDWVRKIPISWIEKPEIIKKLILTQPAERALETIASIAKEFWGASHSVNQKEDLDKIKLLESADFFTAIKLLTLGDAIGRATEIQGGSLDGLYQIQMDLLLDSTSGNALLFDPELEDQTASIKAYWDRIDPPIKREERNHLSFFGVEAMQVGCREAFRKIENSADRSETFPWPDLIWAENYLKSYETQEIIKRENPHLAKQPLLIQTMASLARLKTFMESEKKDPFLLDVDKEIIKIDKKKTKFLPVAYYALRDLSKILDLIAHPIKSFNHFDSPLGSIGKLDILETQAILEKYHDKYYWKWIRRPLKIGVAFRDRDKGTYRVEQFPLKNSYRGGNQIDENYSLEKGHDLLTNLRPLFKKERWIFPFEEKGASFDRRRLGPHLLAYIPLEAKTKEEMNPERIKDLLTLSSVKELQIVATLGYFKNSLLLFESKEMRTFFLSLMVEPPLLVQELKTGGEAFAKELAQFVKDGYRLFENLNQPEISSFFLDLSRYFNKSIRYVLPQAKIDLLDSKKELKARIRQKEIDPKERTAHLLDLAAHLEPDSLDIEDASDLLIAHATSSLFPLNRDHPLYSLSEETSRKNHLLRFQSRLKELLSSPSRDEILNTVLDTLIPGKAHSHKWEAYPSFPLFITQDRQFRIDTARGFFYEGTNQMIPLPQDLLVSDPLKLFLNNPKEQLVQQKQPDQYEWTGPDGFQIRVAKSKDGLIIQREIKKNIWTEKVSNSEKFPIQGLLEKNDLWLEIKSDPQRYWIASKETGAPLYLLDQGNLGDSIHALDPMSPWILALPKPGSIFAQIEENGFVFLWKDPTTNTVTAVEAPRLELHFQKKNGKLTLPGYDGFFVSETQGRLFNLYYRNSIVMENGNGEYKVLFPNPFYNLDCFKTAHKNLFAFDVSKDSLIPQTKIDWLYLAHEQIGAQEYTSALKSLMQYDSPLRKLKEEERALLEIFAAPETANLPETDTGPENIAVRAKALSILEKDTLDYQGVPIFKEPLKQSKEKVLDSYIQFQKQIPPSLKLPMHEEKWLIKNIYGNLVKRRVTNLNENSPDYHVERDRSSYPGESSTRSLDWIYLKTELQSNLAAKWGYSTTPSNGSLFRHSGLSAQFGKLYDLCMESTEEAFRKILGQILKINPALGLSRETLQSMLIDALTIIANSNSAPHERASAATLLALVKTPRNSKNQWPKDLIQTCKEEKNILRQLPECNFPQELSKSIKQTLPSYEFPRAEWPENLVKSTPTTQPQKNEKAPVCPPFHLSLEEMEESRTDPLSDLFKKSDPIPAPPIDALKNIFALPGKEQPFAELSKAITEWKPGPIKQIELRNIGSLAQAKRSLEVSLESRAKILDTLEEKIIDLANTKPTNPKDLAIRELGLISGFYTSLSLNELAILFLQSDPAFIAKRNPALSCKMAEELLEETKKFLILSTISQKEKRTLGKISELEKAMKNGLKEEIQLATEALDWEWSAKRSYKIESHPEYLVFEYWNNLLLRENQVAAVDEMLNTGTAKELIMGFGKTAILTPLIALKKADGTKFSLLVVRDADLPTVSKGLQEKLGISFSRMIDVLHFDRKTPLKRADLPRLISRIENAIQERKTTIISSSSLQSLVLRFIEAKQNTHIDDDLNSFEKIFTIFRKQGVLTADEMDAIYDLLKAHYFTQGAPGRIQSDLSTAVSHVFEALVQLSNTDSSIHWNFFKNSGKNPLTQDAFKVFKPHLVAKLLDPKKSDKELSEFLRKLSPTEHKTLSNYLQEIDERATSFVDKISSQRIKNILSVWKEEVCRLLFITASKQVGEHYGKDPSDSLLAIPYAASDDPVLRAMQGTHIEIANYAEQMHLFYDLPTHVVRDEIELLKSQILKELSDSKKPLEETEGYRHFIKLSGQVKGDFLFKMTPAQFKQIEQHIAKSPAIKNELIGRHILPALEVYNNQAHTNANIFEVLFQEAAGFSGTLWNFHSFPTSFRNAQLSDTEIRTLSILLNGKAPVSILPKELHSKTSLSSLIQTIYKTHRGSFADLGGILREYSSEDVVKEIMELSIWENTKTKGIVFFGKNNEIKVYKRGSKNSVLFEECGLQKNELIAYWEQKFTRSADFKLSPNMRSIHTFSRHTKMRDLLQAVWRLRELDKGQKVEFLGLEEDMQIMRETLKQAGMPMQEKDPTLADLFRFVKYNEIVQQKDYTWRGLKLNLKTVLLKLLWEHIIDRVTDARIRPIIEDLFFHKSPENAYDLYGGWQKEIEASKAIDEEIAELKKSKAYQLLTLERDGLSREVVGEKNKKMIEKSWAEIKEKTLPHLAQNIQKFDRYNLEVLTHTETSTDTNTNVNTNVNTNIHQEVVQEISLGNIPDRYVFLWKEGGVFEENYFTPSSKLSPNLKRFPEGSLALPDFEKVKQGAHPMDHLDVTGEDRLGSIGIRPVSRHSSLADPELLESWNTLPNEKSSFALIIQNKSTKQIKLMLLSPWDALMFRRILENDRSHPTGSKREVDLALYHTDLGIIQASGSIAKDHLKNSKEFLRLKTQWKFFNGCVEYNKEELEVLRSWSFQKGSATLRNKFSDILHNKPASEASYERSSLQKVLEG